MTNTTVSLDRVIEAATHCLRSRQPKKAERIVQLSFVLAGNNPDCLALYGSALMAQGKTSEATAVFEDVFRLTPLFRWRVLQAAVAFLNATTYLEIGVAQGCNILRIAAPVRIGVDPMTPSSGVAAAIERKGIDYFPMTSDEFFQSPPTTICSAGIDVAFVDGLHTYKQSLMDVENCLKFLNPGGVIFMHDCNPPSQSLATPALSVEEGSRFNPPGWNGAWTGDVWKTIVHLRSCRNDLSVGVLDCDFGIGVVTRGSPDALLSYSPEDIDRLSYNDLEESRGQLLGLFHPQKLFERLRSAGP